MLYSIRYTHCIPVISENVEFSEASEDKLNDDQFESGGFHAPNLNPLYSNLYISTVLTYNVEDPRNYFFPTKNDDIKKYIDKEK